MSGDTAQVKPKTKTEELKQIISEIHSISIDIRDKTYMLTSPPETADKQPEVATGNVGEELLNSLRNIQGILREAYETLSTFV